MNRTWDIRACQITDLCIECQTKAVITLEIHNSIAHFCAVHAEIFAVLVGSVTDPVISEVETDGETKCELPESNIPVNHPDNLLG